MHAELQAQVAFHLTGRRAGAELAAVEPLRLRPALLARYRDLTRLRYDFPVVLVQNADAAHCLQSLTAVVDAALQQATDGQQQADRMRKHAHAVERRLREMLAGGAKGWLKALWIAAAAEVAGSDSTKAHLLNEVSAALPVDGELLDCGAGVPIAAARHVWRTVQQEKSNKFNALIERLTSRLTDILRAELAHSDAGRTPQRLAAAVGTTHRQLIDFDIMASLLVRSHTGIELPPQRRARIEEALDVLKSQRFYSQPRSDAAAVHEFEFATCASALKAYKRRSAEMTQVAKAIAIAELETENRYNDARHDVFFANFTEDLLSDEDRARFPDYLICIDAAHITPAETARLTEALAAGLPFKAVVQADDVLEASRLNEQRVAYSTRVLRLTRAVIDLNEAFVLQAPVSQLLGSATKLAAGLQSTRPALFAWYTGAGGGGTLPAYLMSAAALESRAFPSICFDPSAGEELVERLDLSGNPQAEADWPAYPFMYADADSQRIEEEHAFTFVDFVACDARYAAHFAQVAKERWNDRQVPAAKAIGTRKGKPEELPTVTMVDHEQRLQKALVDDKLIAEARRCLDTWHSLQELGGLRGGRRAAPAMPVTTAEPVAPAPPPATTAAAAPEAAPAAPASDDPYIETPRCSSCNECVQLNPRVFAYDGNKQAYIAHPEAATFKELVEAAEACQVAIIHPGKPKDPNEPDLPALLERAAAFA